ncbi:hypothetical protein BHU72_12225 [Desulfuribacillus stibiiarsenatis]|uniref:DUF6194 domain-containing protein n=1 Tax=Desulfuribacillus stibiiarsenatis TaxID=1390249 RepID=A0A1E5L211_9FIRM|nr:DUF6194 family protein [Desulfuribacillus stibiiarsenatis]OEH84167.1 hypothetical protein BHU72_12225 [Desulfuribacillus stibiiarsenatis]
MVKPNEIMNYCLENFPGTKRAMNWGEEGIFYNPDGALKRGIYLLTFKDKDGANDRSSNLSRENVYRLNIGIRKETFIRLFGHVPARPSAGNIVDMPYDFTGLDTIMPHPIYAWMSWICVINPSAATFERLKPFMEESYHYALEKYKRSIKKVMLQTPSE